MTALIRQNSSELRAIKADDGRLRAIDLYNLFSKSSLAVREMLLQVPVLREFLVESYLQFLKANPGKQIVSKHLEGTIRKFVEEDEIEYSIKRLLDILLMTREHKVDESLLHDYYYILEKKASTVVALERETMGQQDDRLIGTVILSLIS